MEMERIKQERMQNGMSFVPGGIPGAEVDAVGNPAVSSKPRMIVNLKTQRNAQEVLRSRYLMLQKMFLYAQ